MACAGARGTATVPGRARASSRTSSQVAGAACREQIVAHGRDLAGRVRRERPLLSMEAVGGVARPDRVRSQRGEDLGSEQAVERLQRPGRLRGAAERVVDHDEVVAMGDLLEGLVAEVGQRAVLPAQLDLGVQAPHASVHARIGAVQRSWSQPSARSAIRPITRGSGRQHPRPARCRARAPSAARTRRRGSAARGPRARPHDHVRVVRRRRVLDERHVGVGRGDLDVRGHEYSVET